MENILKNYIKQMLSHTDIVPFLNELPNLNILQIKYEINNLAFNHYISEANKSNIHKNDCIHIAEYVKQDHVILDTLILKIIK